MYILYTIHTYTYIYKYIQWFSNYCTKSTIEYTNEIIVHCNGNYFLKKSFIILHFKKINCTLIQNTMKQQINNNIKIKSCKFFH